MAVQTIDAELGASALPALQAPQAPAPESILTLLVNDIAECPHTFTLVLDDYHVIETEAIHNALAFLVDHLPPQIRLVIATRADPPLPLSRLRVKRHLAEVRAAALRFTADEAAAFLNQAMGLNLSASDVAALETRTEGWIAGLQLAALSMHGQSDLSGFIRDFAGSNAYIVDYLLEEVLRRQTPETESFLLRTSILDRLNGSLCDALTDQRDGRAMLERLERGNLFLVPLDDDRTWYRYHHLFADVLRRRLQQTQADRVPDLHRRASAWFEQHLLFDEALNHALAASDYIHAAQLLEDIFQTSLQKGTIPNLLRWMNRIPAEYLRPRPRLCLAYAWNLSAWTSAGDPARSWSTIEEWTQAALMAVPENDPLAEVIRTEALVLRANTASIREDFAGALDQSQRALEHLPHDNPWRVLMTMLSGEAHALVGDARAATDILAQADAMMPRSESNDVWMLVTTHLADARVIQGKLHAAADLYRQVVDAAAQHRRPPRRAGMGYSGLGHVLYEHNQLDEALSMLQAGREIIERVGGSLRALIVNAIPLARVQQTRGADEHALKLLSDLALLATQERVHELTQSCIAAWRAYIQLRQGDLNGVAQWAAKCGLSIHDASPDLFRPFSRQVEYTTFIRWRLHTEQYASSLDLIERLIVTAQETGRDGHLIESYILQALTHAALQDQTQALVALEHALELAEPEGYVRLFIDEGKAMASLLREAAVRQVTPGYTGRLLAAFPEHAGAAAPDAGRISLTERELEVMRLVAEGLSDREIADRMTVVLGTVRRHLFNVYSKLGAHSRTKALARARELGLL
jgi:LuxR family maltose regulon positive regulatory protein